MHIEESGGARKIGIALGYLLNYFLFTTILFVIFLLLKKHGWAYPKVMLLTASVAILGIIIRRALR